MANKKQLQQSIIYTCDKCEHKGNTFQFAYINHPIEGNVCNTCYNNSTRNTRISFVQSLLKKSDN